MKPAPPSSGFRLPQGIALHTADLCACQHCQRPTLPSRLERGLCPLCQDNPKVARAFRITPSPPPPLP